MTQSVVTQLLSLTLLLSATAAQPGALPLEGGVPDSQGAPVFIQGPEPNYYIVKGKPVTISCRAAPAVQISFKCGEVWMRPRLQVNVEGIDEETGVKYLESSIDVNKEDVEEVGAEGECECECHAWNSLGLGEESSAGRVQIATLKKRFDREPISSSVEVEHTTQLQCLPPEGVPMPQVFWQKDGVDIDVAQEINYIISNEGNLIINQARLQDTGNYTCGAQNLAGRRLSESATLTVYVNGGWSTWSTWSECTRRCSNGVRRRTRTCDQPLAVHGAPCAGEAVQRQNCTSHCPEDGEPEDTVHGDWSTWSSWSTCGADCRHHRHRMCDNPAPLRGGRDCAGSDLDTANCSDGTCSVAADGYDYTDTEPGALPDEDLALLMGALVALLVFIIVGVVVVLAFKRQYNHPCPCLAGSNSKKFNKNSHDLLHGNQPDLTQTVVTIQNHHTLPHSDKPNNNHLNATLDTRHGNNGTLDGRHGNGTLDGRSLHNTTLDKDSEHIYSNIDTLEKRNSRSLQRLLGEGINGGVSELTGLLSDSKHLSDCETRPNSLYSATGAPALLREGASLPASLDAHALAAAQVDHMGGRLTLPESGVSVTIPVGAIPPGCTEEIYLAVCRNDSDRPKLNDSETILGPVIMLWASSQQALVLKKPVIVSFQHCASIKHGQWGLSVYSSNSAYDDPEPRWQCATTLGQETINTPVYTQLDQNQCHVMTDTLQRYVLVGEPNMARKAIKILRLAVFAPAQPSSSHYNLRVYFLEDTRDAFEHVRQVEQNIGGRLVSDKPKQILFQFGGGNLCLSIDELGPGWRCKLNTHKQDIPFFHIWSGTQNGLHCSFALEREDRTQSHLAATINVYQRDQTHNKQTLTVACNLSEPVTVTTSTPLLVNSPHHYHNTTVTAAGLVALDPPHTVFRLPLEVKQQLGQILDPPNARGNDWRMLAQRLSVDRYIPFFATKTSPTEHILDLWEVRHRDDSVTAVTDLMNSLRAMGRTDAAAVLETAYQPWL